MVTKQLQIENLSFEDFCTGIERVAEKVAGKVRPDLYINQKKAALIMECDARTVYNYLKTGRLKDYSEGNANPKISLYEVIQIVNSKK